MINDIINTFKYCMHPDYDDGHNTFKFPYEWIIKFSPEIRKNLYDFTPSVLTGLNVSYNGQGIPVFFQQTGAPVQVDVSLAFKEIEIITKEKLRKEFSRQAFGLATESIGGKQEAQIAENNKATNAGGEATRTIGSF